MTVKISLPEPSQRDPTSRFISEYALGDYGWMMSPPASAGIAQPS